MTSVDTTVLGRVAPAEGERDLLRAALRPADEAAAAWRRWRVDRDLDGAHGRAHDVFPAVASNLASAQLGDDAGRLAGLRRRTWATNQLRFKVAGEALDVLAPLEVLPVLAKGIPLSHTAYHHVGDRSMGDIDMVVGPDHFDEALELLEAAGWFPGPDSRRTSYAHAFSVFDVEGNEIDLHRWTVFPRFCREPEKWLERSVPFEVAGRPCRRYRFADELVLAVVHGIGPGFSSAIRWPIDAARLIDIAAGDGVNETESSQFWTDVAASADELGISEPLAAGLRFCADELGVPVPREALAEIEASSTDRVVRLEWNMLKRGIPRPERIRPFVDTERASGRRPSVRRYLAGRIRAARRGGSGSAMVRRRIEKAERMIAARRDRRRSW